MKIEMTPTAALKPYDRNARIHTAKQIEQIAKSIQEFGFTNPILIDSDNMVAAGHGRLLAAKHLGIEKVPTVKLEHLTKQQIKAYIIADNKIGENSSWDLRILHDEMEELKLLEFDIDILGFEPQTVPEFKPNLPNDEEIKIPTVKLTLTVTLDNEVDQKELFEELRDRGYKVKI